MSEQEELALAKWCTARRKFLGLLPEDRDFAEGLRLAALCTHEDARWLVSLFPGGTPESEEEVLEMLSDGTDGRSLCFTALVGSGNIELLMRAAVLDYPLAKAEVGRRTSASQYIPRLICAREAAQSGEPEGLTCLAEVLRQGPDAVAEKETVVRLLQRAAAMDYSPAMLDLALHTPESVERYRWLKRAARLRDTSAVHLLIYDATKLHRDANSSPAMQVACGEACAGKALNVDRHLLFHVHLTDVGLEAVQSVVRVYNSAVSGAREALFWWVLLARRRGVVKDMRRLVSNVLWRDRVAWAELPRPPRLQSVPDVGSEEEFF
jgi:hypothetical protein